MISLFRNRYNLFRIHAYEREFRSLVRFVKNNRQICKIIWLIPSCDFIARWWTISFATVTTFRIHGCLPIHAFHVHFVTWKGTFSSDDEHVNVNYRKLENEPWCYHPCPNELELVVRRPHLVEDAICRHLPSCGEREYCLTYFLIFLFSS